MHERHLAYSALLSTDRIVFSDSTRMEIQELCIAEEIRYQGKTFSLLVDRKLPLMDRLAMASMSSRDRSGFANVITLSYQGVEVVEMNLSSSQLQSADGRSQTPKAQRTSVFSPSNSTKSVVRKRSTFRLTTKASDRKK